MARVIDPTKFKTYILDLISNYQIRLVLSVVQAFYESLNLLLQSLPLSTGQNLFQAPFKMNIWKPQGVPQSNNAACLRNHEEEENPSKKPTE